MPTHPRAKVFQMAIRFDQQAQQGGQSSSEEGLPSDYLKRTRIGCGISTANAAAFLSLPKSVLHAMEEGRCVTAGLHPKYYKKLLRRYATFLGISKSDLQLLEKQVAPDSQISKRFRYTPSALYKRLFFKTPEAWSKRLLWVFSFLGAAIFQMVLGGGMIQPLCDTDDLIQGSFAVKVQSRMAEDSPLLPVSEYKDAETLEDAESAAAED